MKKSFLCAFKGALLCIKTERNFRIHLVFAFYVLLASAIAQLSSVEWIIVLICIGSVTGAEIFNTAIEKLCDTLHPEQSAGIGLVKDMTAGAVLMFAVSSAVIGSIIFFSSDKLVATANFVSEHVELSVLIVATVPLALFLVFRRYKYVNKISHDNDSRAPERR